MNIRRVIFLYYNTVRLSLAFSPPKSSRSGTAVKTKRWYLLYQSLRKTHSKAHTLSSHTPSWHGRGSVYKLTTHLRLLGPLNMPKTASFQALMTYLKSVRFTKVFVGKIPPLITFHLKFRAHEHLVSLHVSATIPYLAEVRPGQVTRMFFFLPPSCDLILSELWLDSWRISLFPPLYLKGGKVGAGWSNQSNQKMPSCRASIARESFGNRHKKVVCPEGRIREGNQAFLRLLLLLLPLCLLWGDIFASPLIWQARSDVVGLG